MSRIWFVFRERDLLVVQRDGRTRAPEGADPPLAIEGRAIDIGRLGGLVCLAARASAGAAGEFAGLRSLYPLLSDRAFRIAGRALQLVEWDETHRFCGRCAEPTVPSEREHARNCPRCGLSQFPRLSPAVIMAVTKGDRILLGRPPRLPEGMYSVLAGFVEPGESLEETVAREVREEAGIEVADVRYFGSQPWPFPNSLMVAFTARWAAGELRREPEELDDLGWFAADALPRIPPRISIARTLIDAFLEGVR